MSSLLMNLNAQQREAVLSEEKRVLVLAGAGSGKTKTLIQKLLHLLGEQHVKPSQILAITFTRNATNEMVDRLIAADDASGKYEKFLNDPYTSRTRKEEERTKRKRNKPWLNNLTVRTFHSLCYKIMKDSGGVEFDNQFRLLTDEAIGESGELANSRVAPEKPYEIMQKMLREQCQNVDYLLKLKRYILDFYVDKIYVAKQAKQYANPGQITYTTLKGDQVKSKSERDIADWLFRHHIAYEYEPSVNFRDFDFRPDFFLPQADLFIEHISNKSYPTRDKEEQFEIANRLCVKTFEAMTQQTHQFNLALERIVMGRIHDRLSAGLSLNFEEEFKSYHDKIDEFLKMLMRVLAMLKAEGIETEEALRKSAINPHERVRVFYELAVPLFKTYEAHCTNRSYLDFDDLVIRAIRLLENHPDIRQLYQGKYRYVLVDEFQDVNQLQVRLLDLLLTPHTQLFCVGDDWQSIYGFRGSQVDYIVNFERHFPSARVIKLDVNYRSTQTIVGASNEVIKHNQFKIDKEIRAHNQTPSKIHIYRAKDIQQDGVDYLIARVQALQKRGYGREDVLVLYRRSRMFAPFREALREAGLSVTAKTIHAAKGLEARAAFIIGLTDGTGGFPDVWLDDVVFRVVRDVKYDLLMEEERRLFYVALTRAKEELYLITQLGSESTFIDEIPAEFYAVSTTAFKSVIQPVPVCAQCRTELKESYRYCPTCGRALSAEGQ